MSVVPLSRANNVSIMLTQFSQFKQGADIAQGIRRAVVTGKGLSLERLSLLLQVRCFAPLLNPVLCSDGCIDHISGAAMHVRYVQVQL